MTLSDPVANMLSSIRNANMRGYRTVSFFSSSFKLSICEKLKENNFLSNYWYDKKNRKIKAEIKYRNKYSCINELKKISKPSQHIHIKYKEIKKKCQGYGVYFISTSFGILTHKEALEKKIGGKLIFLIR